jgi:AcrR family transcriptional regulator
MTAVLEARTDTRRRRKAERPQEIIEAAFTEFSRNGYATTTLDQIAERAGVTKGTIYVYFENKEHLFISMVREFTKTTMDIVQDMFETH